MKLVLIGLFGVLGVFARYFFGILIGKYLAPPFPYGTFVINLTGAFFIGVIYVLGTERSAIPPDLRIGLLVGFFGGYTTFSSYCLESLRLVEEAQYWYAAAYFILSPVLGFLAVLGGTVLTRTIIGGAI